MKRYSSSTGTPIFGTAAPPTRKTFTASNSSSASTPIIPNLSPPSEKWPLEKFEKYDAKTMYNDLFVAGYDDMAILQPTYLGDFYKNGFNTTERNSAMKKSHPDRFILNGAFDPRDGEPRVWSISTNWPRSTRSRASSCTPPNGAAKSRATS